ncbi:MAG: bifunctional phosphoglucose/phosphomannose isomerase [Armatimonadota bacterium]
MATEAAGRRQPRVKLDDPGSWSGLDPSKMLELAVGFPAQVQDAARIGRGFAPPARFADPRLIVLSGMGGSAVAGDFLARLCEAKSPVPFLVNRGYAVPASVGPDTLFIASSHSGNTEETLESAEAALARGARILCATTDGQLAAWAREHEAEGVALVVIPGKGMPPRASLGYSFVPLAIALERLGIYPGASAELEKAVPLVERLRDRVAPAVPAKDNPAKELALALFGRIPWVQGTIGIMSAAAYRWRTQFNENSKALAYSSEYPELDHNEVIGWEQAERWRELVSVVMLRSPSDHRRVRARVDITREKFIAPKAPVHVIEAEGESPLAQLLWMVYLGDFVSIYLAFLNGVDPASIASINLLKAEMAKLPT